MFVQGSYTTVPVEVSFMESTDRLYSLAAVLDEINEGATLLNGDGQLLWRNRAFDKLLVDNREGHLLVAGVIEFATEFYQELLLDPAMASSRAYSANVGRVEHEFYFSLMPKGMLGPESYLLCVVKRMASRWSSYEEQLRQHWSLTEREAQVAVECLRGKKNLEIADFLKISVETVNKHLDKVYQKAGVRGRSELASRLLDNAF
ncbi:MAG: helix-turn-helix transcriptional regulator [Acidobacteria bacterium]|nr:helix-turn-helix transcriptional regulator [Acidobacteriota bacterium]